MKVMHTGVRQSSSSGRGWTRVLSHTVLLLFVLLMFLTLSCASRTYVPERTTAVASWYGLKFHGKKTASGEKFDMYASTAAHKLYPFGTKLKVTYPKTGQSTVVVINDRGPFVHGRDLDLSYQAAKDIGLLGDGVGEVKLARVGHDGSYSKNPEYKLSNEGPFTIQLGSFSDKQNAERLKDAVSLKYDDVYLVTASVEGRPFYRVRVGSYLDRQKAYERASALSKDGYDAKIMRHTDPF